MTSLEGASPPFQTSPRIAPAKPALEASTSVRACESRGLADDVLLPEGLDVGHREAELAEDGVGVLS